MIIGDPSTLAARAKYAYYIYVLSIHKPNMQNVADNYIAFASDMINNYKSATSNVEEFVNRIIKRDLAMSGVSDLLYSNVFLGPDGGVQVARLNASLYNQPNYGTNPAILLRVFPYNMKYLIENEYYNHVANNHFAVNFATDMSIKDFIFASGSPFIISSAIIVNIAITLFIIYGDSPEVKTFIANIALNQLINYGKINKDDIYTKAGTLFFSDYTEINEENVMLLILFWIVSSYSNIWELHETYGPPSSKIRALDFSKCGKFAVFLTYLLQKTDYIEFGEPTPWTILNEINQKIDNLFNAGS